MQNLFFRNAPSIFVVLGTIYGLMLYVNIPRGGTEAIFVATSIMLGYFIYSGKVIQQLYEKVYTDSLTGLKSRAGFEPMTEKRKGPSGAISSLLMVDVDDFKAINDEYGHPAGDVALKSLASILRKTVRDKDSVFRWGGDEFVIILPDASPEVVTIVAERIRAAVENYGLYSLTVSIGIAKIINDNVGAALAEADKAMYEAKKLKNSIATFKEDPNRLIMNPQNCLQTEHNADVIWIQ